MIDDSPVPEEVPILGSKIYARSMLRSMLRALAGLADSR